MSGLLLYQNMGSSQDTDVPGYGQGQNKHIEIRCTLSYPAALSMLLLDKCSFSRMIIKNSWWLTSKTLTICPERSLMHCIKVSKL